MGNGGAVAEFSNPGSVPSACPCQKQKIKFYPLNKKKKLILELKSGKMESINMILVYGILCDFKTFSSQANILLVIEFHLWKNALCNSRSVFLLANF